MNFLSLEQLARFKTKLISYIDGKVSKCYSPTNTPPYPVTKVNNKTGNVSLNYSDVGAVQNSGVTGEDGSHKMAMSWNGSKVIVGIDNNAAVKTLVDESYKMLSDTGWVYAYGSTNWVSNGSAPFLTAVRRNGNVVNMIIDLTARVTIPSVGEGSAKLVIYNIRSDCKPQHMWNQNIRSQQGKMLTLKMVQDSSRGLSVKVYGEQMAAGDRIAEVITYML